MSSLVKAKLKNARDSLAKKNYTDAKDASLQVLQFEPDNYNANVFLGLASLELAELSESEQAYKKATELNPEQLLAWQGLSKFYERIEDREKYADVLRRMADIHAKLADPLKCAEALQKYIDVRREHGHSEQITDALYLLLPQSPLHPVLSTLPPPDPTNPTSTPTFRVQEAIYNSLIIIREIAQRIERDEDDYFKKEFEKRRTRLNAGPSDQIRKEIGRELWGKSRLPSLYGEVLNHPNTDDELRRETESKLLRYKQKYMHALPSAGATAELKENVFQEIESLINGAVLLHVPDELAWMLFLEGKDVETIDGYDHALLREFMSLFPSHPLTTVLTGYFIYIQVLISDESDGDDEGILEGPDVGYDMIVEAYSSISTSLIATRIVAEVHLLEIDYSNAIQCAESGAKFLSKFESENGKRLPNVRLSLQTILATSLVHLYPPKHHRRALDIITEILATSPDNIAGLMARAYVLETDRKWDEAADFFDKTHKLLGDGHDEGLRAREEYAWCISQAGNTAAGIVHLEFVLQHLKLLENRDHDLARCYWRLGSCLWSSGEKTKEAYQNFITSLKCDPNYAPAYTSLGIYYTELSSPPDPTRASKCFQKAFELDSREADAAHRLAQGFADEREWDLVEVVARRTIEGEGGLDGGLDDNLTGKYLPTNAWAWKALGVVELVNRNYVPAISALQVALRAEPKDHLTWLRLGEAYFRSGRHSAALKALGRSQELGESNWICSYFIAEVHRQIGQYEDAVHQLEAILSLIPSEVSVLATLAQTYLDLGKSELLDGFFARAQRSFLLSVKQSINAINLSVGFRAVIWKTAADALYLLCNLEAGSDDNLLLQTLDDVRALLPNPSKRVADLLSTRLFAGKSKTVLLELTIALYDHRIDLGSSENTAVGSAWFDLSVALRTLVQTLPSGDRQEKVRAQATKALSEAIRTVPMNDSYWVALGDVNFASQPKTAQHAYIKALEIDSKNAGTWTNLGLLYLHHDDYELANEAFYRAQSANPDFTLAWVGQALVAIAGGHSSGAIGLLEHAVGLADIVADADYQYTSRVFDRLKSTSKKQSSSTDALLPAFFVLDRYVKSRPTDPTALHLYALVCESLSQPELAIELITRAITLLEALYEETEDTEIERQFTIAHSNIGRLKLSLADYDGALESFESALGLLPDEEDQKTTLLRVHARFGSGISRFKLGNLESALEHFEAALEVAGDNVLVRGEVTVMLSQTMWAIGSEESRDQAKTMLLECISTDPDNLVAISTLAAMGIMTEDESLIDAALTEILSLPVDRRLELDPQRNVDSLLIQHHLGQNEAAKAFSVAQGAVFADPSSHEPRNQMATLMFQTKQHDSVLPVLAGASESPQEGEMTLKLRAVAEAIQHPQDSTSSIRLAQKNVLMKPQNVDNWRVLALANASKAGTLYDE